MHRQFSPQIRGTQTELAGRLRFRRTQTGGSGFSGSLMLARQKRGGASRGQSHAISRKERPSMSALATVSSRVVQALRQSSHPVLRTLAVEETESTVVITGRVTSYYLKQLAQETVMPVLERRALRNHVVVMPS